MFRRSLAADAGMIFPYDPPQHVALLDEEHADPARHDLHPRRRDDRADRHCQAAVARPGAVRRAGRRGARDCAAAARPSSASRAGDRRRAGSISRLAPPAATGQGAPRWVSGRRHSPGGTARRGARRCGPAASATRSARDDAGNIYYQDKKDPARRWVIYNGNNDGSRVPPDWQLWLRGTIDELPDKALPPVAQVPAKPPTGNLTGTMAAFRPDGALGIGQDPAGLDRRLRALDPRISVRASRRIAADRAWRSRRAAAAPSSRTQAPAARQRRGRATEPGRRDADGAAGRGPRHPQQAQRDRPERRAAPGPVGAVEGHDRPPARVRDDRAVGGGEADRRVRPGRRPAHRQAAGRGSSRAGCTRNRRRSTSSSTRSMTSGPRAAR